MNEPELKKAMDTLEFLSQDEKLRMAYEARQKFLRDQASMMEAAKNAEIYGFKTGLEQGVREGIEQGIEQGIEKGIEQGMRQGIKQGVQKGIEATARRMLRKGMLTTDVADATELPLERVEQLKHEEPL